jgi:integrase
LRLLRAWLSERGGEGGEPLFPTRQGQQLSRDALEQSMRAKKVTPHVLRHTAAMRLLKAGVDTIVIALWLGHEQVQTTHIYVHADLAIKEQALA